MRRQFISSQHSKKIPRRIKSKHRFMTCAIFGFVFVVIKALKSLLALNSFKKSVL